MDLFWFFLGGIVFGSGAWYVYWDVSLSKKYKPEKVYDSLARRYNQLVRLYNSQSKQIKYLEKHRQAMPSRQFTTDEIKILIQLCHPDKHGGKDSASRMTRKLLEMRQ